MQINKIIQFVTQCEYPEAIKDGSVCGEAAREAIGYRFKDSRVGKSIPINASMNVAAVTLIFPDGSSITRVNQSSNSEELPLEYRHAEARAIATAMTAAIDDGKLDPSLPRFTSGSSVPEKLFSAWKPALKDGVSKIIVYSDRSPCSPCDKFLKRIFSDVNYELFFAIEYRRGGEGNLGEQIVAAKKFLDNQCTLPLGFASLSQEERFTEALSALDQQALVAGQSINPEGANRDVAVSSSPTSTEGFTGRQSLRSHTTMASARPITPAYSSQPLPPINSSNSPVNRPKKNDSENNGKTTGKPSR